MKYYENIPEENSLDSMEGIENAQQTERLQVNEEKFRHFASDHESMLSLDDFATNSNFSDGGFTDLGYPELGKRWAFAYLKKQIDLQLLENRGLSHTLSKAYNVIAYSEKIDNELRRNLGEMLGKLYEASGSFNKACEYYWVNCKDKYKDKLDSVRMKTENLNEVSDIDIWEYIPEGNHPDDFPDFVKATTSEKEVLEAKLLEDFLKTIPKEILNIDTKEEFASLMKEAGKIIERYESTES